MPAAVVPCAQNTRLNEQIDEFVDALKTTTHTLGTHGLSEAEFYESGILEGAIQRIRGEYSATMQPKRDFVARVLNHMQDEGDLEAIIRANKRLVHFILSYNFILTNHPANKDGSLSARLCAEPEIRERLDRQA